MNTTETLQRFEETVQHYLLELDSFSLEQLQYTPQEDQWSLGQMYLHLVNSALYMHLKNIDVCLQPNGETGVKTEAGTAVFNLGDSHPYVSKSHHPHNTVPHNRRAKKKLWRD